MARVTALDAAREAVEGASLRGSTTPVVDRLPAEARALVVDPSRPSNNPTMRCPNGHRGNADTMVDVAAEGLEELWPDAAYVCTSCVRHARRMGRL